MQKKAKLIKGKSAYGCADYKAGCDFTALLCGEKYLRINT
jgi:hypothetical protein